MEEKLIAKITDYDFGEPEKVLKVPKERFASRGILLDDRNGEEKIAIMFKSMMNEYKLVGGGVDFGETFEDAFMREVLEETGCECEITKFLGKTLEIKSKANFRQISYVYVGRVKKLGVPKFTQKEIDEGAELLWVEPKEALKLIEGCIDNLKGSPTDLDEQVYQTKFVVLRDAKILSYYLSLL